MTTPMQRIRLQQKFVMALITIAIHKLTKDCHSILFMLTLTATDLVIHPQLHKHAVNHQDMFLIIRIVMMRAMLFIPAQRKLVTALTTTATVPLTKESNQLSTVIRMETVMEIQV